MNTHNCPSCQTPFSSDVVHCPVCGWLLQTHLPTGTKLQNGKYTIGKKLGQGGFGITYQGANTLLGMRVAIKELFLDGSGRGVTRHVIPRDPAVFEIDKTRFKQEAKTLGQFNHPSVVRVLDFFEENNTCYLVMEHLQGNTLAEQIQKGPLEEKEAIKFLHSTLDGLEVVHKAEMLHRDIKPDNIFLTTDGRVVLIDFGTARAFELNKTSSHTRMVTPGYAPLEQYASAGRLGPASDLYSLGATLYHAMLGKPPPDATDRVVDETLEALPVPSSHPLAVIIHKTLAIKISERPQTAREVIALLEGKNTSAPNTTAATATTSSTQPAPQMPAASADKLFSSAIKSLQTAGVKDHSAAITILSEAADLGHTEAWFQLGILYEEGIVVTPSIQKAMELYQQACNKNHKEALYRLGLMHLEGKAVPPSVMVGLQLMERSAAQGYRRAQYELGRYYQKTGTLNQAATWFRKAAVGGSAEAQYQLAYMFEHGEGGLPKDRDEALYWYTLAAIGGIKNARSRKEQLEKRKWPFF